MTQPTEPKPCPLCNRRRGHKRDCIYYGTRHLPEPTLAGLDRLAFAPTRDDGTPARRPFDDLDRPCYLPLPNTTDEGRYITRAELVLLLRANATNPAAIVYLADMLE